MDSGDGSRGNTMDSNSVSNIRNSITNSMVNRGGIAYRMMNRGSITNSMVDWGGIADSTMNRGSITNTITKTGITISTIQSLWFSFSLALGNMYGTSRVSNIRNSIANSMVNRGSITYSMVDRCSITNSVVDWGSIADSVVHRSSISKMSVSTVISISLSGSKGSTTNQKDSLDHVDLVTKH